MEDFQSNDAATQTGRILIIDDDPVVAGMLGISLSAAGHQIIEANSGEAGLDQCDPANNQAPDIVFLDIEMAPGIDGYETCRRLRAQDPNRELPVIFLSGHDGLENRLLAYDAGGDDFISKPFNPDEVLRKAALAIRHKRRQEAAEKEKKSTFDMAMTAMSTLGESGVALAFSRSSLSCKNLHELAVATIESMASFGIECHVQLRVANETITYTPRGPASPLEVSVFDKLRSMDRIFSFKNRTIINFETVAMLVQNMPVENEALCGRIRDHAAMIAESAELAAESIRARNESSQLAKELRSLADSTRNAVASLRANYGETQFATRLELETMVTTIEGLFAHMGLSDRQERDISNTVRGTVERVLSKSDHLKAMDEALGIIVDELVHATESKNHEEAEGLRVEIW